jgi:hypothetical protein
MQCVKASLFLLLFIGGQTAFAQTSDAIALLKSSKQLTCVPEETVFCSNVHVNCAGRTKIPTFTFKLQMKSNALAITVPPDFKEFTENYQRSKLEWDEQAKFLVIAPSDNKGYIKLTDDGRYVFRHYPRQQEGVMSIGKCEQ